MQQTQVVCQGWDKDPDSKICITRHRDNFKEAEVVAWINNPEGDFTVVVEHPKGEVIRVSGIGLSILQYGCVEFDEAGTGLLSAVEEFNYPAVKEELTLWQKVVQWWNSLWD